jgi:DNA-directed RNA polymerase specialized sigma24 family protein
MNDSVLVEALRARDPGALAALYDSYAESIYRYAWALLESSDTAQVALRDTLIAAEAHVHALSDPDRLRYWLYALARGECLRRRSALQPEDGGETVPGGPEVPEPSDGDLRLVAVNAVAALPEGEREILDLLTRHAVPEAELAGVLGITPAQAGRLRQDACERLQEFVTTEILARNPSNDCAGRAAILADLADPSGTLDEETRERLLQHGELCTRCAPHAERQVSAAKVFNLLPQPALPETLRVRVMSCFIDPELVPYRRYVARRTGLLDPDGFPVRETKGRRRWPQALAGAVAAVAIVVAAIVLVSAMNGAEDPLVPSAYGALPLPLGSTGGATPAADPAVRSPGLTPVAGGTPPLPMASPYYTYTVPLAVARSGSRPPVMPVLLPTPSPSASTNAPVPRPAPSSSPSSTAPTTRPTGVGPPVTAPSPPVTSPRPPTSEPTPTTSHQHDHAHTPCPSRTRPAPPSTAAPAPSRTATASPAPPGHHGHARHARHARHAGGPETSDRGPSIAAPDSSTAGSSTAGSSTAGSSTAEREPSAPAKRSGKSGWSGRSDRAR